MNTDTDTLADSF